MRIILDFFEGKGMDGKKTVCVRTFYTVHHSDGVRIRNCANEVYGCITEAFDKGFDGGFVEHLGERRG